MVKYINNVCCNFDKSPMPIKTYAHWEIYILVHGQVELILGDGTKKDGQNMYAWVIPPGLAHGWSGSCSPVRRYIMHFSSVPEVFPHILKKDSYLARGLSADELSYIETLYKCLKKHHTSTSTLDLLKVERAKIDLLIALLRGMPINGRLPRYGKEEQHVDAAVAWYEEHMNLSPGVDDVAASVGLSAGHMRRIFQTVRGRTPHQVFIEMRIARAKELIASSKEDLLQIASACGFNSNSDFSRAFMRHVGIAPSKWRQGPEPSARPKSIRC